MGVQLALAAAGIGIAVLLELRDARRVTYRPGERLALLCIVLGVIAASVMGLGSGSQIHQIMMPVSMLASIWYGLWWFPNRVARNGRLAEFPFSIFLVMALSLLVLSPAFVDVLIALDPNVRESWLYLSITDAGLIGGTAFAVASGSLLRKRLFGFRLLAFALAVLLVVFPWVRAALAGAVVVFGFMLLRVASYGPRKPGTMLLQAIILVPAVVLPLTFLGGLGISGLAEKILPEDRKGGVEFREVAWEHFTTSLQEDPFSLDGRGWAYKWTEVGHYTVWNDPHSTWAGFWEAGRLITLGFFSIGLLILLGNAFRGSASIPGFRAVLVIVATLTSSFAASALISATSPADKLFWIALGLLLIESRRGNKQVSDASSAPTASSVPADGRRR